MFVGGGEKQVFMVSAPFFPRRKVTTFPVGARYSVYG